MLYVSFKTQRERLRRCNRIGDIGLALKEVLSVRPNHQIVKVTAEASTSVLWRVVMPDVTGCDPTHLTASGN
jgi:hypothetical protein